MGGVEGTLWVDSDITTIAPILVGLGYWLTIRYISFNPFDALAVSGLGFTEGRICIFADGGTNTEQDKDCDREAQRIELEDDGG